MVLKYDPLTGPNALAWSHTDESERVAAVLKHHVGNREAKPNERLHAAIHAVVENQVAMGDSYPTAGVLARLMGQGLDRHDAVHAIGSLVSEHMFQALRDPSLGGSLGARYEADLIGLTAEDWKKKLS
jgi:hypothetical protein